MKLSKTLAVLIIAGGLSTSVQATNSGIDSLLTRLVSTAISVTAEELNNEVKETVANTAHKIDSAVTNARVEIRDVTKTTESEKE